MTSSARIQQTRILNVSWRGSPWEPTNYAQNISVPWLIDEVRVLSVSATTTGLQRADIGVATVVDSSITELVSPNLFGGPDHGTHLGIVAPFQRQILEDNDIEDQGFIATSFITSMVYPRYIFPPGNRLRVNGSYNFATRILSPEVAPGNRPDNATTTFSVTLEFVQYVPDEVAIQHVSDMELMRKSGKRRM